MSDSQVTPLDAYGGTVVIPEPLRMNWPHRAPVNDCPFCKSSSEGTPEHDEEHD